MSQPANVMNTTPRSTDEIRVVSARRTKWVHLLYDSRLLVLQRRLKWKLPQMSSRRRLVGSLTSTVCICTLPRLNECMMPAGYITSSSEKSSDVNILVMHEEDAIFDDYDNDTHSF